MKFNKMLLVVGSSLLATSLSFASNCPADWPVAVKESSSAEGVITMRVQPGLIQNQKLIGGIPMEISSSYFRWAEVRGQTLVGSFVNRKKTEQWLPIGTFETSQRVSGGTCYKLKLANGLSVREVVKSHKADCYPLPSWMCGREKSSYLELRYQDFSLTSGTSVMGY